MSLIKTKKGGFQLVPEGKQILHVDSVELVPSGKPSMVKFVFSCPQGGTIKESQSFSNPIALDILGKRCDIALGGTVDEGTEIEPSDLEGLFLDKTFEAMIVHKNGKTNPDAVFANISYFISLVPDEEEEDDDL